MPFYNKSIKANYKVRKNSKAQKKLFGEDLFGQPADQPGVSGLCRRFIVPPFSVLDTKQGYWQDRKRAWTRCGIKSEIGREGLKTGKGGRNLAARVHRAKEYESCWEVTLDSEGKSTGISIFDPVLCELIYTWFVPPGGRILDPFAGGSVRGIVASALEHPYVGIDLSEKQVLDNVKQGNDLLSKDLPMPTWVCGDAMHVASLAPGKFDAVFSCPPYFDLEIYSEDPRDISNMDWDEFRLKYRSIIHSCVAKLKKNSFAVFVVSDIRDPVSHFYRSLPAYTVECFESAEAMLYNWAILVNSVGTLPIRTPKNFNNWRKLGRGHQDVLVFFKGASKDISSRFQVEDSPRGLYGKEEK